MKAIVYTSNTGYTATYAKILSDVTGLPAYEISDAAKKLPKNTDVIYMGWLMASMIKDYGKASKRYKISAVIGVGLCETGCLLEECRKASKIPVQLPFFTVQGGMDHEKLRGIYKFMINMLIKMMDKKKDKSDDDCRMLDLIKKGGNYVSKDNLGEFLRWYEENK